jgi:hypothetical protein
MPSDRAHQHQQRRHRRRAAAHHRRRPFNGATPESVIFTQLRRCIESRTTKLGIIDPPAVHASAIKNVHRTRMGEC